jgi:hypothetical protein
MMQRWWSWRHFIELKALTLEAPAHSTFKTVLVATIHQAK